MATATLDPDGAGNYTQWPLVGGTRPTIVSDDNDASYLNGNDVDLMDSYTMDDMPSSANGGIINSVKVRSRGKIAAGSTGYKGFVRYSATDGTPDSVTPALTTSWQWVLTGALAVPGGGDWTTAIVNATEAGVKSNNPLTNNCYVAEIELQVDYTPAGGGWSCLVVGLLGPVLGAGLLLSHMPGLIDACNRASQGKHVIHGHEAVQLYADLKADKHRSYLWL